MVRGGAGATSGRLIEIAGAAVFSAGG
jgi:hypothetical protein